MKTADLIAVAKDHPTTVAAVLTTVAGAVQADPSLIPDAITAFETKNFAGLAIKHIGLLLKLAGLIGSNQALVDRLGTLTP